MHQLQVFKQIKQTGAEFCPLTVYLIFVRLICTCLSIIYIYIYDIIYACVFGERERERVVGVSHFFDSTERSPMFREEYPPKSLVNVQDK